MSPIRSILNVRYFRNEDGTILTDDLRLSKDQLAALELRLDANTHPKTNGWSPQQLQHLGRVGRKMCVTQERTAPNIVAVRYLLRDESQTPKFLGISFFEPEERDQSPYVWFRQSSWQTVKFSELRKALGAGSNRVRYMLEQWKTRVGANGIPEPKTVLCIPKPIREGIGNYVEVLGPYDVVVDA